MDTYVPPAWLFDSFTDALRVTVDLLTCGSLQALVCKDVGASGTRSMRQNPPHSKTLTNLSISSMGRAKSLEKLVTMDR